MPWEYTIQKLLELDSSATQAIMNNDAWYTHIQPIIHTFRIIDNWKINFLDLLIKIDCRKFKIEEINS